MSYVQLLYHIVFRPKDSVPCITIELENLLYRYIWGIIKQKGGVLYRIGGMPDHVHIFVQLPATIVLSDFMRDLKAMSSKFLRENADKFPLFPGWGKSYRAITHSYSDKDKIVNYIINQKEHHKSVNFHDELLALLKEAGVEVNMQYFLSE